MIGGQGLGWPQQDESRPLSAEPSGLGWPQDTDGVHPRAEESE